MTYKCDGDRMLLVPRTPRLRRLSLGCLGRAQAVTAIEIYGYSQLSNHGSILFGVTSPEQATDFKRHFLTNLSKEAKRYQGWFGAGVLGRRNRTIPLADREIEEERLKYVLSNGTKEHLVGTPMSRVFMNSARASVTGKNDVGDWYDRTKLSRLRKGGHRPSERDVLVHYEVKLSKLPSKRHLSDREYRRFVKKMVRGIEREARAERPGFLGARAIRSESPFGRPRTVKRSPAPICHASPHVFIAFVDAYRSVRLEYRAAMDRFRETGVLDGFPEGTQLPGSLKNRL